MLKKLCIDWSSYIIQLVQKVSHKSMHHCQVTTTNQANGMKNLTKYLTNNTRQKLELKKEKEGILNKFKKLFN